MFKQGLTISAYGALTLVLLTKQYMHNSYLNDLLMLAGALKLFTCKITQVTKECNTTLNQVTMLIRE